MDSSLPLTKNDLLNLLEDGHFVLLKQPVLALRESEAIFGYTEILSRCVLEEREQTSSGSFTGLLEQSWLMDCFDKWLIHCICRLVKEESAQPWSKKSGRKYAISLSEQSVTDSDTGAYLQWMLENERLSGEFFIVQFDLGMVTHNSFRVTQLSRKLNSLGCQILITGAPGPEQLVWCRKNLDAKYVRVDVAGCSGPDNRLELAALYRPLVSACHALNMTVVGQFVDDLDSLSWLKQTGFHYAQGYEVARPTVVPKINCSAFLNAQSQSALLA